MSLEIYIITGDINCGKTTALIDLLSSDSRAGKAEGVISHGVMEEGTRRKSGYRIESLRTGEQRTLLGSRPQPGSIPTGRFFMYPEVLQWAQEQISCARAAPTIAVDELGPLELKRQGYYLTVRDLLEHYQGRLYLVIRDTIIDDMLEILEIDRYKCTIIRI